MFQYLPVLVSMAAMSLTWGIPSPPTDVVTCTTNRSRPRYSNCEGGAMACRVGADLDCFVLDGCLAHRGPEGSVPD